MRRAHNQLKSTVRLQYEIERSRLYLSLHLVWESNAFMSVFAALHHELSDACTPAIDHLPAMLSVVVHRCTFLRLSSRVQCQS